MGRKKKYFTTNQKKEAQQKWVREYYERNKEDLSKTALKKYHDAKRNNLQDNKLS